MPIVFFILAPFLTFAYCCGNLHRRVCQVVVVLFFALFGYCHTFEDTRADSHRKYESFTQYRAKEYSEIISEFRAGEVKDIYEDVLFTTLKQFTNNPHILMLFVGLFGGFFYMLVIKRFLEDRRMRYTMPIIILLAFMVIESNIPLMGGIRNFTAFPLFMYSTISLLVDNKKWWIVGLLLTPLIHFGYIVAVVATLFIWLVRIPSGIMHYVAIVACIGSIFLDTSSYVGAIDTFVEIFDNEAITERVSNYGEEDTEIHFQQSLTTRLTHINNQLSAIFIASFLIYIHRQRRSLRQTPYDQKLYKYLLFFIIFSFSLISFSVVGQRFVYIAMVFLYLYMLNIYQRNQTSAVRIFIWLMPLVYAIHIAWTLYNCYCNVGIGVLYQPLPFLLL